VRVSRAATVAVAAWVAVVLVGSSMVWAVISRAGEQVAVDTGPATSAATSSAPRVTQPGTVLSPRHPRHSGTPGSRGPGGGEPSGSGTPSSSPSSSGGPGTPSTGGKPSQHPSGTTPPAPVTRSGTWSGAPGTLTVSCRGSSLTRYSLIANPQFSAHVDERGPSSMKVKFESQGENETETEVRAWCSGGPPRFSAESSSDDRIGDR
jgi:hypothetical protein